MTVMLQQSRVYIWSVVWLLCLVLVARASAAQGEDDLTAPIRERAEALLEILRTNQWEKVAPFVIVSTGRDDTATRRRMEIPTDANPEVVQEQVSRWFKQLYGSVKPGGIINVQLKGTDDAFIIYRHDDIDGFYMHRVGGEWYYMLDE
jgi:hypothetical protein